MKGRLAASLLVVSLAWGSEASHLAKRAKKSEKKERVSEAYLLYSQAALLEPGNRRWRARAAALESRAAITSHVMPEGEPAETPFIDEEPAPEFDRMTKKEQDALDRLQPPPELRARPDLVNLDLAGDSKALFQQLAATYGLEPLFDSDFQPGSPIRFRLANAGYREALQALAAATSTFVVPISPTLFLVGKDTPQKRADLEQTMTVAVPMPQALTQQELIELTQVLRQALAIEKVGWDSKTSSVVIRDRVSRVRPAQLLLQQLLNFRPQVVVDLKLIEIRKSDQLNLGVTLPNMFNIVFSGMQSAATGGGSLPPNTPNPFPYGSRSYNFIATATQAAGTVQNAVFRGLFPTNLSLYTISIGAANALANFSQSLGRTAFETTLRASDSQPSTFHIGDRYPILTGSYSVGTSVQAQYVPPPAFTFEDLGITIKITPHLHGMEETTVDLESEFKLLSGQAVNGNPIISNRKLKTSVRLRDDEWGLVSGLITRTRTRNREGTWGLSNIPLIGRLFEQRTKQDDSSEILVLIKPRLLNLPSDQVVTREVRVGTETRPFLPL